MVSAFLNTVKIPELRRRIMFTLAVIVIVRLGAAITTPESTRLYCRSGFAPRSPTHRRRPVAALFNLFSGGALENCAVFSLGHHALHQRIDHDAVADRGDPAAWAGSRAKMAAGKRSCSDALRDSCLCIFQGYCWRFRSSIRNRITRCCRGSPTRSATSGFRWWMISAGRFESSRGYSDYRNAFFDVAG